MGIRDSTRAERAISWLKSHGSAERSFARALRVYFADQGERVAKAIGENFPGALPSPDQLPLIFRADDEHARLMPIVRRNLSGIMIMGARAEQRAARHLTGSKAADDALDLPEVTRQGIRRALDELEQQEYWRNIQNETETNLRAIIEQAIDDKLGDYQLGMLIRQHLGGMPANKRAQKIARTETTGAMNAGHLAYDEELINEGIVTMKEWNAIGDSDCRDSHAALNGTRVPARANFIVGSSPAPYPGHFSLPGKERINCRCLMLSVLADEFSPDPAPPAESVPAESVTTQTTGTADDAASTFELPASTPINLPTSTPSTLPTTLPAESSRGVVWDDSKDPAAQAERLFGIKNLKAKGFDDGGLAIQHEMGREMARLTNQYPGLKKLLERDGHRLDGMTIYGNEFLTAEADARQHGTVGNYLNSKNRINLAAGSFPRNADGKLKLGGQHNAADGFPSLLRHEVAHWLDYRNAVDPKAKQGLLTGYMSAMNQDAIDAHGKRVFELDGKLVKSGRAKAKKYLAGQVSEYGSTNAFEAFAESFAAYTHPSYGTTGSRLPKNVEAFFDRMLKD